MDIFAFIGLLAVVGLILGLVATVLWREDPIPNIICGIVGSIVGGSVYLLMLPANTQPDTLVVGLIGGIVAGVVILAFHL